MQLGAKLMHSQAVSVLLQGAHVQIWRECITVPARANHPRYDSLGAALALAWLTRRARLGRALAVGATLAGRAAAAASLCTPHTTRHSK